MEIKTCYYGHTNEMERQYVGPVYHINSYQALELFEKQVGKSVVDPSAIARGWKAYGDRVCFRFEYTHSGLFELYYGTKGRYMADGASIIEVNAKQRSE